MNWIRTHIFLLLLIFIGATLAATNYTPGTFLSGWDTLHPEFNLPLAFTRTINGVWRADQGLGAVAIHSHMAELPRLVLLWISSLALPLPVIRYAFFFLCLLSGIIGMYAYIFDTTKKSSIAFAGALTYLANLGTVQLFIVPFEMFAVQYALLPWILLTAKNFLVSGKGKHLVFFLIAVLLAAPMAYAATLWYAFFLCFALYCLLWRRYKRAIILIAATVLLNLYWILPNVYAVATHGREVQESKINRLFTPEAFAKNQEFGNLTNVPILKSFLFDWQLFNNQTNQFEEVTAAWQKHLDNPIVLGFGYVVFGISLLGIIQTIRQKNKVGIAMLPLFFIPLFLLLNGTWPINAMFEALGRVSPVAAEALRFPFTKFSILFMAALSFYVAEGIAVCKSKSNYIVIAFSILSVWYFLPAFQGQFINPAMRVAIPNDYFKMFAWFATQPHDQRVAILPIDTFWGWTYYKWNLPAQASYQGAGFLQFGIPQPIMDRDYNRWSVANERYQQKMSYAIYSQNPKIIASALAKYHIQWILLDRSVFSPGNTDASLLTWHIPALLTQTGMVSLAKNFGNDISVYHVNQTKPDTTTILPDVALDDHFIGKSIGSPILSFSGGTYKNTDVPGKFDFPLDTLPHDQAYVVAIESKNEQGFPLELCISNNLTNHCDLFTHLTKNSTLHTEQFLLPPLADFGTGYTLNFNNFVIHGTTSVNEITQITVSKAIWDPRTPSQPAFVDRPASFFWPQLLEWMGLMLIPLPFFILIGYHRK